MSVNLNTGSLEDRVDTSDGVVWHRLHTEREDICEALLQEEFHPRPETQPTWTNSLNEEAMDAADWHRNLLQARLRKVDSALDRLMSGSYGNCSKCGKWIEDTKLEFDPAIEFCLDCWGRQQSQTATGWAIEAKRNDSQTPDSLHQISRESSAPTSLALDTLASFDTIQVRTFNSDYRIFLLDPLTGRALVEGGAYFVEPVEAMVSGSTLQASTIRNGEIGIGMRIEMWVNGKILRTSPVTSLRVERYLPIEVNQCRCER